MARKQQRKGVNSTEAETQAYANAGNIPVPEGIALESDEEEILWRQFSKTRVADDWREFDLVLLSKIVKLEVQIRGFQEALTDYVVQNKRGTPVVNPIVSVVDTLQRQQLSVIRSLSLNQTGSNPKTVNQHGKKAEQVANQKDALDDLIAKPTAH